VWRRGSDVLLVTAALALDLFVWGDERGMRHGGQLPVWLVLVPAFAVFGLLLMRHRYPRLVFAANWAYSLFGIILPGYEPFAGLLLALHAVARQCSRRTAVFALIACSLPFGINSYNAARTGHHGTLATFIGSAILWSALLAGVWGLGRRGRTIAIRAREVLRRRDEESEAAVRAERLRLARELHDIVANAVSGMLFQAAGARSLVGRDNDQVCQSLRVIEDAGVQALAELHRLLGLLRADEGLPADTYHGDAQPGIDDVSALIARFRDSGLAIETSTEGERHGTVDPSVSLAAFRVTQEALANSSKHGGTNALVRIHQVWRDQQLTLTIRDTGGLRHAGSITVPSSGKGLVGLAERVTLVGGSLEAGPVDGGFLVRAELPIRSDSLL
jgi:signal transduction histidine kinase